MTFYGLPKDFGLSFTPDLTVAFPHFPGPNAPETLREHQAELSFLAGEIVLNAILDSERGAILVAGIAESKPLGRPARFAESAAVLNEAHFALKLKLQGLQQVSARHLPPRERRPRPPPARSRRRCSLTPRLGSMAFAAPGRRIPVNRS
jgi:hypothetical protein